jgi:hypothetical protein
MSFTEGDRCTAHAALVSHPWDASNIIFGECSACSKHALHEASPKATWPTASRGCRRVLAASSPRGIIKSPDEHPVGSRQSDRGWDGGSTLSYSRGRERGQGDDGVGFGVLGKHTFCKRMPPSGAQGIFQSNPTRTVNARRLVPNVSNRSLRGQPGSPSPRPTIAPRGPGKTEERQKAACCISIYFAFSPISAAAQSRTAAKPSPNGPAETNQTCLSPHLFSLKRHCQS